MIKGKVAVCLAACILCKSIAFAQVDSNRKENVYVPARVGIIPDISSQGKKDKTTTSNFSLNILGGTTGSVNGIEMATLFNIDKGYMQGVQAAGYFNMTEGYVNGVQMASLFNLAKSNVTGIQMSGVLNLTQQNFRGIQAAGVHNQLHGSLIGAQMGGVSNFSAQSVKGVQMAAIANVNNSTMHGLQMAGIVNYTKHLKGLQIGLINIADTSSGFGFGLINIVRKGYHKITVSTNEVLPVNVAYKSGNPKLYNILMAGFKPGSKDKIFSYGYGIGHELKATKWLTLNPELTSQFLYLGNWNYNNILNRLQVLATAKVAKHVALFAGPAFSVYYSDQPEAVKGYQFLIPENNYHTYELWHSNVTGWFGFTAGITIL